MTIQPYRPLELMKDKITKSSFNDFIGVWDDFVPASFCDELIEYFEDTYAMNSSTILGDSDTTHKDFMKGEDQYKGSLNRKDLSMLLNYHEQELAYKVHQFLTSCAIHYISEYDQLRNIPMISSDIKFQQILLI